MDKKLMLFSERKELAEEYEKWINTPLDDGSKIKDCALSVITFMQIKGFCKIPENAAVLTREEYQRSKGFSREEVDEISETAIKNARKETAEKFAERLKVEFDEILLSDTPLSKIDEICKEITEGR